MSDLHHYVECGLDNVYLLDAVHENKADADGIHIIELDSLHHAIAKALVLSPHVLRGQELLFLRTQLGLTAQDFCRMVGISSMTLMRWEEASHFLGKHADTSARLIYAAGCSDGELGREILLLLLQEHAQDRETVPGAWVFGREAGTWRLVGRHNLPNTISE